MTHTQKPFGTEDRFKISQMLEESIRRSHQYEIQKLVNLIRAKGSVGLLDIMAASERTYGEHTLAAMLTRYEGIVYLPYDRVFQDRSIGGISYA